MGFTSSCHLPTIVANVFEADSSSPTAIAARETTVESDASQKKGRGVDPFLRGAHNLQGQNETVTVTVLIVTIKNTRKD